MKRLLILGAGVFAEEVADLATAVAGVEVIGMVEGRDRSRCGAFPGRTVYWIDDIHPLARDCAAICAIGSPERRTLVERAAALGLGFATLVHPSAVVPSSARLAEGAIVGAGVVFGAAADVGPHVIVNRGCLVGHHVRLGAYATLGPGCNIGGLSTVGAGASIGIGAIVLDRIAVGDGAVVGAGSLVNHDVAAGRRVAGNPARSLRPAAGFEGKAGA